ncbi:MAG: ATP-binding cassette domain-containing protein [Gemmataceae bacterium]
MEHAISASPQPIRSSAIEAKAVRKHFGDRTILNDISLDFRNGETVAILGPSGGGKSTFCASIAAFVLGYEVASVPARCWARGTEDRERRGNRYAAASA